MFTWCAPRPFALNINVQILLEIICDGGFDAVPVSPERQQGRQLPQQDTGNAPPSPGEEPPLTAQTQVPPSAQPRLIVIPKTLLEADMLSVADLI